MEHNNKAVVTVVAARGVFIMTIAIFLVALLYVGYRSDQGEERISRNADAVEANQTQVSKNSARLVELVYDGCLDSQLSAEGVNVVLDTLIEGAQVSTVFSPSERATRIKRYSDAKMKIPVCNR